ncbi:MAG: nucleoside triphosphate pyrophosphohydrolase [Candidatus Thiodiazotropha sp. LLP2]
MEAMQRLLKIMAKLRDPDKGCPWDLRQTYSTIVPYTLEEAYEVADTIQRGEMSELRDELGDLLFQVVFYSQIAKEDGHFDFNDVSNGICSKMIRRHPHVFSDKQYQSDEELRHAWEQTKAEERSQRNDISAQTSHIDGVAKALPALIRAEKLQKWAARVGFDWPDAQSAFNKVREELEEVTSEMEGADKDRLQDELGDLLFSIVNVVRLLDLDAEQTMSRANEKFEKRFRYMERRLNEEGITNIQELSLEKLDNAWERMKRETKQ